MSIQRHKHRRILRLLSKHGCSLGCYTRSSIPSWACIYHFKNLLRFEMGKNPFLRKSFDSTYHAGRTCKFEFRSITFPAGSCGRVLRTSSYSLELTRFSLWWKSFYSVFRSGIRSALGKMFDLGPQLAILILAETVKATGLYCWARLKPRQVKPGGLRGLVEGADRGLSPVNPFLMQGSWRKHPLHLISFMRPVELLQKRFLEFGWCPHEHKMLCGLIMWETTGLFTASRLKRPFSTRELSHAACISDRCSASFIKPGTYSTRHTLRCRENSKCSFLGFDSSYLAEQIEEGHVPLVRLDNIIHEDAEKTYVGPGYEETEPLLPLQERVEIQHADSGHYIALSHVWSHGLGNPLSNTLPTCQLRRLKAVAAQMQRQGGLIEEPAIWIDTLCVPVDPRYQTARRKAISGIVDVFRHARYVVVLDADIEEASRYADRSELCIRLLRCHWMRRLHRVPEAW